MVGLDQHEGSCYFLVFGVSGAMIESSLKLEHHLNDTLNPVLPGWVFANEGLQSQNIPCLSHKISVNFKIRVIINVL